jgi:hypothetical protein
MNKFVEKMMVTASGMILPICLASILALPAISSAASPKADVVGKPQRIQDPQRLQKAMHALLHKAYAQHRIINDWYRKARLATAKMEAKERKESAKALAKASQRACQIQLAMARTPEDITIPGCRPKPKSRTP